MGEYDLRNYSSQDFLKGFRIDTSERIRFLREKLTKMDLGQAGGVSSRISLGDSLPLLRISNLAELPGEKTREVEVKVAIGMQILGLNEDHVLEMRRKLNVKQTESDGESTRWEMLKWIEKKRVEDPKGWEEAVRIVNEAVEEERRFAIQIKTN